jgi:hypothetical protein
MLQGAKVVLTSSNPLEYERGRMHIDNSRVYLKKTLREKTLFYFNEVVSLDHKGRKLAVKLPGKALFFDFGRYGDDAMPIKRAFAQALGLPLPQYESRFSDTKVFAYGSGLGAVAVLLGLLNLCTEGAKRDAPSVDSSDSRTLVNEVPSSTVPNTTAPFKPSALIAQLEKSVGGADPGIKGWRRMDLADGTERWMAEINLTAVELTPSSVTVLSALVKDSDVTAQQALIAMGKVNLAVFGEDAKEGATGNLLGLIKESTERKDQKHRRDFRGYSLEMMMLSTTGQMVYSISK